ncbi:MAG: ABC transporter ATP-binding protein, partial [Pseudolysinimonas sp.]
ARHLASEGRTVFLSSHLMSEMAQTADHIIVLGRGRVIADAPVAEIVAGASAGGAVRVRSPHADRLAVLLAAEGGTVVADTSAPPAVLVTGLPAERIGELAAHGGVVLHELSPVAGSLEAAYLALTQDEVEYQAGAAA